MRIDRVSSRGRTRALTIAAGVSALALALAACGSSSGSDAGSTTPASTAPASTAVSSAGGASSTSLKGVCPDTIVIQSGWMPVAEKGALYELVGPDGTANTKNGSYNGPLGDTGVNISIRSGGPFLGNQSATATLYSDPSVLLGEVSTDDAIAESGKHPVIAVMAPMDKSPKGLIWDPSTYQFTSIAQAGKQGVKILKSGEDASSDILVANGTLKSSQIDYSWDGSPARFITDGGKDVELDYVTQAPYKLEQSKDWGKPVAASLLLADAGYTAYENALVTTPDKLKKYSACLKAVVPMIQQAGVNFIEDPTSMIQPMIDFATKIKSLTPLSAGLINYSVKQMKTLKVTANGTDGTFGSFDTDRVDKLIASMAPVISKNNYAVKPGLTAADLVTNQFLDPSISLR